MKVQDAKGKTVNITEKMATTFLRMTADVTGHLSEKARNVFMNTALTLMQEGLDVQAITVTIPGGTVKFKMKDSGKVFYRRSW